MTHRSLSFDIREESIGTLTELERKISERYFNYFLKIKNTPLRNVKWNYHKTNESISIIYDNLAYETYFLAVKNFDCKSLYSKNGFPREIEDKFIKYLMTMLNFAARRFLRALKNKKRTNVYNPNISNVEAVNSVNNDDIDFENEYFNMTLNNKKFEEIDFVINLQLVLKKYCKNRKRISKSIETVIEKIIEDDEYAKNFHYYYHSDLNSYQRKKIAEIFEEIKPYI